MGGGDIFQGGDYILLGGLIYFRGGVIYFRGGGVIYFRGGDTSKWGSDIAEGIPYIGGHRKSQQTTNPMGS